MNFGNTIYNYICRTFLQVARIFVEVYLYCTQRPDNMVKTGDIIKLGFNNYITYNVIKNNKNYKVVFSSESLDGKVLDGKVHENIQKHILDFKLNSYLCLSAKNLIVNCHLTKEFDDDVCDITEYVRYFCYYFDKNERFGIFLNYLEYKHGINLSLYKDITLYMNDMDFSEKVYDIKVAKNMSFSEVFS